MPGRTAAFLAKGSALPNFSSIPQEVQEVRSSWTAQGKALEKASRSQVRLNRPAQSVLDGLEAWRGRSGRARPMALTEPWHGSGETSDESRSPVVRFTTQPVN
ncbi:hypothetical protein GRJ2_002321000 [Grus japonensis]|uniref:Uncharacterized protein n=1 Tax=Grus japonensis TaxID=30415 RepID=A0ABC9XM79_GRUJA